MNLMPTKFDGVAMENLHNFLETQQHEMDFVIYCFLYLIDRYFTLKNFYSVFN